MQSDAFRAAVEAEDADAVTDALAENVVFLSPAVFKPYEGKQLVGAILTQGAMQVFEDFRYLDHLEDGDTAMLVFEARVGDRQLNGLDLLRFNAEGKVRELMVMVRPLSGLNALAEAMGRRFQEAGIGTQSA